MDLKSPEVFWPIRSGLLASYPPLESDAVCDVAIIGAGITGALLADALADSGVDVLLLDKREAGHGSTSASTGLLQYEIDLMLTDLIERHGEEHACRAFRLCLDAVDRIRDLATELGDCGVSSRPSCYLASQERDVPDLRTECDARRRIGIDVEFLGPEGLRERLGIDAPGALWSAQAAEVDAYRLTHRLFARARGRGAGVFDRTEVIKQERVADGWRLKTDRGPAVSARWLVLATGYEAALLLKRKRVALHSTFAAISQPQTAFPGWTSRCLIWESARPYFYARTTDDDRILVGGEDAKFRNASARDALLPKKVRNLEKRFAALMPMIAFETEYAWAGTFAETPDGLPYIGEPPEYPGGLFALGYGGNGITFSAIAADLLRSVVLGRPDPHLDLFRFDRGA
ncbi:MAG: FAD-binding oxidoreductase [Planctomyces sp.]|nr:FAD-binding oxidoreductase [Planctomyces sp.]